jgi:hypothetical protein
MLLSHRYRFLFVHIAKTGGTSIRAALAPVRYRDRLWLPSLVCHGLSRLCGHRIGAKLPRHASAWAAREMLPRDMFEELFKFAFVRNPWDRQLSAYTHFVRERQDMLTDLQLSTFADFTRWLIEEGDSYRGYRSTLVAAFRRPQSDQLCDRQGRLLVDALGRFEHLEEDFASLLQQVGLTARRLPHKRCSQRPRDYRPHYDDRTAERVATHYQDDITRFGYTYDPAA